MQSKLIGDWKIGEIIGRGGQAKVYAASKGEGTPVCALKIINSNQPKKRARFIQEVRKHAELSDRKASNIIPILDHNLNEFENGGRIGFIVMPKAEANLEDQIDIFGGRVEFCLEVFRGIVNGVVQAHGIGIIHRDLKPSNILFMDRSLREPLISDFGICFVKDTPEQKRFTDVNETVGARFFMAPEQERGGIVDVKETADIYTLGKILHYMLTIHNVIINAV
jgi:serine/threonine protein kinase